MSDLEFEVEVQGFGAGEHDGFSVIRLKQVQGDNPLFGAPAAEREWTTVHSTLNVRTNDPKVMKALGRYGQRFVVTFSEEEGRS